MSPQLRFPDARTAADVLTFASRAARLGDGAVRLRAAGGTLSLSAAPVAPRGMGDDLPTVLAMRFVPIDAELVCDLVVDAGALGAGDGAEAVALPDGAVSAAWAGISPPRAGWERAGFCTASALEEVARVGMAEVARAVPTDAGEEIVRTVRGQVWGRPAPELGGIIAGAAFAAVGLGFVAGEETAAVSRMGTWTRVSLRRGHVLVRAGNPTGLTAIRRTGG